MNILYISKNGLATNLAKLLKEEGHQVKLCMDGDDLEDVFDNIVDKTDDWRKELDWVGEKGLIVFDDNGYGKLQDQLREQGYKVFGGNFFADKLEYDREYTQKIFRKYEINTHPLKTFKNYKSAVRHVEKNPDYWVIKREGENSKFVTYVGEHPQGQDVIEILKKFSRDPLLKNKPFSLQRKAAGIEIGVARYFNGKQWVGPIEMNIEHPHLFTGDIGPMTDEMGTLVWYTDKENRLYEETLKKIQPFLEEMEYKGDFAINTIVNEEGVFALETTARMGCPAVHAQTELNNSKWSKILAKIAEGEDFEFNHKKGYAVVVSVSVPPFPFQKHFQTNVCSGITIDTTSLSKEDMTHIHLDEVALNNKTQKYYISEQTEGFVLYVTGYDKKSPMKANERALKIIQGIKIPKMFYRIDIGEKFEKEDKKKLKKWGWI